LTFPAPCRKTSCILPLHPTHFTPFQVLSTW
jgi:hypothetical protein